MRLVKKWRSLSLIVRILSGLAVGVVLGLVLPGASWIGLLGDLFVGAFKSIALLLVPLGCSLFGISNDIAMELVGVGFIISVIQDSLETALNSSSDAIFTATAEFYEWK